MQLCHSLHAVVRRVEIPVEPAFACQFAGNPHANRDQLRHVLCANIIHRRVAMRVVLAYDAVQHIL